MMGNHTGAGDHNYFAQVCAFEAQDRITVQPYQDMISPFLRLIAMIFSNQSQGIW